MWVKGGKGFRVLVLGIDIDPPLVLLTSRRPMTVAAALKAPHVPTPTHHHAR